MITVSFSGYSIEAVASKAMVSLSPGTTVRILALKRTGASAAPTTDAIIKQKCYEVQSDGSLLVCTVKSDGTVTGYNDTPMRLITGNYDFYLVSPAIPLDVNRSFTIGNGIDLIATPTPINTNISRATTQVALNNLIHYCHSLTFRFSMASTSLFNLDMGDGVTVNAQPISAVYKLGNTSLTVGGTIVNYLIAPTFFSLFNNVVTGGGVLLPRTTTGITVVASLKINTLLRPFSPTTIAGIAMRKGERSISTLVVNYVSINNDPPVNLSVTSISISPWVKQSPESITPIQ